MFLKVFLIILLITYLIYSYLIWNVFLITIKYFKVFKIMIIEVKRRYLINSINKKDYINNELRLINC